MVDKSGLNYPRWESVLVYSKEFAHWLIDYVCDESEKERAQQELQVVPKELLVDRMIGIGRCKV